MATILKAGSGFDVGQDFSRVMTEEQIERHVASRTDRLDARYMARAITTDEYHAALREIDAWADRQYATMSAPAN